jgi:Nitroreductase
MSFSALIKERYSVRKFADKKVEKEILQKILDAGRLAPTASNLQPQRILVVQSETGLQKLKEATTYHFGAPLILIICYDEAVCWKHPQNRKKSGEVDASIVTTHMMLEITNLGLGTTWVGYFDSEALQKAFNLPSALIPIALLPIGYPAENSEPTPKHFHRLDLECTVFYEEFPKDY